MGETKIYKTDDFQEGLINSTIKEVINSLEERGYNPINQIVGYIISGDPGYISNHKEARSKIVKFERSKLVETIIKGYLSKD